MTVAAPSGRTADRLASLVHPDQGFQILGHVSYECYLVRASPVKAGPPRPSAMADTTFPRRHPLASAYHTYMGLRFPEYSDLDRSQPIPNKFRSP